MTRELPPSELPWLGAHLYEFRGALRLQAIFKSIFGVVGLLLSASQSGAPSQLGLIVSSLVLLTSAFLDIAKVNNARIEVVDDRLVQFDPWNQAVNSVRISTLHYVVPPIHPMLGGGRIEGDDGHITLGRNMSGTTGMLENVYAIIADRHQKALEPPIPEEHEETVLTAPLQIRRS